jgi:uncharacterized protein (DUF58 family)
MVVAQQHLPYFDPRILSKLEGVTLRPRGTVEGTVSGSHRSPFHGFAAEFAEHREYVPGDDLRYVDWKIYGRSDRVFVKQFEEETNFACHLLLDASESMTFRSDRAPLSKLEFAKQLVAALSYVVIKHQDAVGLITFARELLQTAPPSAQTAHWQQLSHLLQTTTGMSEQSDGSASPPVAGRRNPDSTLGAMLSEVAERLDRRGVVILLSDCFTDAQSLFHGLAQLRSRKHDLRVWQIVDPAEEEFPFDDPTLFRGLEGWADLSVEPRMLRAAYQREFAAHRDLLRHQCRDGHIDFVSLRTDLPIDLAVKLSLRTQH